ncbi:VPS10 domain-containing protein [Eisenibacter elegans]|uniref:VPS10 domain-containing protein n=1 Tax=Eisenibacter elegans TaxID=997 RepID=UPI00040E4F58|nr:hypothetical protein [Eisenibacter elegans]
MLHTHTYWLRLCWSLCLSIGLGFGLHAQQLNIDYLQGIQPRSIGPAGMSGRITAIDVVTNNPDIIYAGAASGGVWKSEGGGIDWTPIFDHEKTASVGAIAIYQANPNIVWVGTGEGNPRNSQNSGYGVWKSIDAGKTWQYLGLEKTRNIHRLLLDPNNPQVAYVGAQGSAWGGSEDRGVFKTTDGGKTWKKILYVDQNTGIADLVIDPHNPNKLIAAMWEFRRWPWFFNSGGKGSGLYITQDGGENWTRLNETNGLPAGNLGRIGVAIARSNPKVVYAIVEAKKNGFYRSDDGGLHWKLVTQTGEFGNRPFYYSEIYVDPSNENRIYSLWTMVSVSEDAGRTWQLLLPWSRRHTDVHLDHHAWWMHPENPDFIIEGNDGGLNISRDRGKTWRFAENIPVGQFYHVNVDMAIPYNVMGGMQDNGSWHGPGYAWKAGGIRNSYFQEIFFGDGFDVVPDHSDERYVYAMSQGGNLGRVDLHTGHSKRIKPVHPEGEALRFNWNAAIAHDPFVKTKIYYGSQYLHQSNNRGDDWTIISPDLTTNDPEKQKAHESGGLTFDVTAAENHCTIVAIAPSPVKEGVIWVGTDDGNVQLTQDGGKTWTNLAKSLKGAPAGSWIPQIHPSPHNAGEAFVILNNYRRDDWTPFLFHTTDYGKTWTNLVDANKVWGYTHAVAQDLVAPNLLFLGTESGLYVSIDKGKTWTKWTKNYPTVPTVDLVIHPREHDLVVATFGRSLYVIDDIRPLRELAQKGDKILKEALYAFEAPDAYLAKYIEASGTRFAANGIFAGENRPYGAMISYSIGQWQLGEKKDSLKLKAEIVNAQGEVIRTLQMKPERLGINRFQWNLDVRGERGINAPKAKPDSPEPSGYSALPGTYTVRLSYGDAKAETQVKVMTDPRMNVSTEALAAQQAWYEEVYKRTRSARALMERLNESKEAVDNFLKQLGDADDEATLALKKQANAVKDSLKDLREMMVGPDDVQGIFRTSETVSAKIGEATWATSSAEDGISSAHRVLLAEADKALNDALDRTNAFYAEVWNSFIQAAEQAPRPTFKRYEPLKASGE